MARARNIKPGLLENELLGEADPIISLAFIGMWMIADKEGRIEDRPKKIKAQIFPYRSDVDMNLILDWLNVNSFISRYQSNVGPIISIVKWNKHQRPHHKEKDSTLPAESPESNGFEQAQAKLDPTLSQAQANVKPSITPFGQPNPPDTGYRIPDTGISDTGSSDSGASKKPMAAAADYLKHLVSNHGYDERTLRTKTQNTTQARQWLADGVTALELDDAVGVSRERLKANDEDHDPPIAYIAKVLAGNRKQANPVSVGINTHGDFKPERYAIDETARKFTIAGGAK